MDYLRGFQGASLLTEYRSYFKVIPDVTDYPKLHDLGDAKEEVVTTKPTHIISGYVRAGGRVLYVLRKVLFGH